MKIYLKYFALIFLISSCKERSIPATEDDLFLYPQPVAYSIDTINGYIINPITGDSIRPLVNSYNDTIKTGINYLFAGKIIGTEKSKPIITKAKSFAEVAITTNVFPVPVNLSIIPIDTNRLRKNKSSGGISVPAIGKKMPFHEPHPVKALPLRYKDAAVANVQYLDVDQGMSSSYIMEVLEDKKGNIWFGTDGAGISKYDGVNFIHYTEKEGLSDNIISSMMEDSKGNIWIGTHNGLNKFDGKSFIQYHEDLLSDTIQSLLQDKKGNIWIGTMGGAIMYDGSSFINYTVKNGMPSDSIISCIEDRKGNIWFGTYNGAARFDGNEFTYFSKRDGLTSNGIGSLLEDRKGNIWMASSAGIDKFDGKSLTSYTAKQGLSVSSVWGMMEDSKGNIWISTTYGGINKFDGKTFTQYNQQEGLSNNKVRSMMEDSNGNIWFGTDGGGVNKLNDDGFNYLPQNEVFANNRVRPIIKDKHGNIWFGTEGAGIGKYLAPASGTSASLSYYSDGDRLLTSGQRSLLEDKENNIWIGSTEFGLIKYDGTSFFNFPLKEGPAQTTIFCMAEDKKGNIWCASSNGVYEYNEQGLTHYNEKEGLSARKAFSLLEDKNGNIWFGTDHGGLGKYDGHNLINYTEKEGLFSKSITSIVEDKKGDIWLGTLGAGVCRFDGKNFIYYTEKEGLSNNNVWSLIQDSSGCIWAGTDKGLNRLVYANNRYFIYNYGLQDGLKAVDFNLHSACINNNNRMWWGTGKNIVTKNLSQSFTVADVHSLQLNYIEINNRFYDYKNFTDSLNKKIKFSSVDPFSNYPLDLKIAYGQNHLTFHFSAIDWSAPDKIKYSYRMIGLDEKWTSSSEETIADYRNLSYGKYEFQVRATGQSQIWTKPFIYTFIISPAWWQAWWFKGLIILAVLILFFFIARFIYYYQLRKERTALEKQLAVQYERQRISAEMHDDIGAGLSGIRLLTEMTKTKVKDEQAAEEVEKIYQSVGDISSKMKEVIWSLNTENDSLSNLVSFIQKQARLWVENYPCELTMKLQDKIPYIELNGKTRRNILLIAKEAVHNIIKHSGANKINIEMNCSNSLFRIIISDNGKGINTEQSDNSGNGLKNMRLRTQQLNGKFFTKNKEGLTLIFEIPLQQ